MVRLKGPLLDLLFEILFDLSFRAAESSERGSTALRALQSERCFFSKPFFREARSNVGAFILWYCCAVPLPSRLRVERAWRRCPILDPLPPFIISPLCPNLPPRVVPQQIVGLGSNSSPSVFLPLSTAFWRIILLFQRPEG